MREHRESDPQRVEQVLDIYNGVVGPEYRLSVAELRLWVRMGTIGPPDVLHDPRKLLYRLLQYYLQQRTIKFPAAPAL